MEVERLEFRHVAGFDKFNLIGSTRKLARVQRGTLPSPSYLLLLRLLPPLCRGLSKRIPKIRVSAHRHKEICRPTIRRVISRFRVIATDDPINSLPSPAWGSSISVLRSLYPGTRVPSTSLFFFVASRSSSREIQICPGVFGKKKRKENKEKEKGKKTRKKRQKKKERVEEEMLEGRGAETQMLEAAWWIIYPRRSFRERPATESFFRWPLCSPLPAYCEEILPFRLSLAGILLAALDLWITRGDLGFSSIINRLLRFRPSCCYSEEERDTRAKKMAEKKRNGRVSFKRWQ